jgi:NadR type nicotinamide-nucleotide adenylyltransferase
MNVGFIVGKFYPPHAGHHYLIDTAIKECDKVVVLVAWSDVESINGWDRADWLRERHPEAQILHVRDNHPVDYNDDTAWDNHVKVFSEAIAGWEKANQFSVNRFYSSELWGAQMAEMLSHRDGRKEVTNHIVDVSRDAIPVSATKVRDDLHGMWQYLIPPVRSSLLKRVVILGGESTGTTTLAKALATELRTVCVPEYGRHFDWAVGKEHVWTTEDFIHIACKQQDWEDDLRKHSGPIMICDTDTVATEMFHYIYMGDFSSHIESITDNRGFADLYIITSDEGVEFEDDGTRFNSGKRRWATEWLQETLPKDKQVTVVGTHEYRMSQALHAIKTISWEFAPPLEYA